MRAHILIFFNATCIAKLKKKFLSLTANSFGAKSPLFVLLLSTNTAFIGHFVENPEDYGAWKTEKSTLKRIWLQKAKLRFYGCYHSEHTSASSVVYRRWKVHVNCFFSYEPFMNLSVFHCDRSLMF